MRAKYPRRKVRPFSAQRDSPFNCWQTIKIWTLYKVRCISTVSSTVSSCISSKFWPVAQPLLLWWQPVSSPGTQGNRGTFWYNGLLYDNKTITFQYQDPCCRVLQQVQQHHHWRLNNNFTAYWLTTTLLHTGSTSKAKHVICVFVSWKIVKFVKVNKSFGAFWKIPVF